MDAPRVHRARTDDEHARALAITLVVCALTAGGALSLDDRRGAALAPCERPAVVGDVLACDGEGDEPGARAWLAERPLDVNAARLDDLTALPRVGPSMARRIVALRDARGGFGSVDELDDVKGIGPKTLARLAPLLTAGDVERRRSAPRVGRDEEPARPVAR